MPVEWQAVQDQLQTAVGYLHAVSQMLEGDRSCQQALHQLNAVQSTLETASVQLLRMEVERCLQIIRENPCPDRRCEELTSLANLYPLFTKLTVNLYETKTR